MTREGLNRIVLMAIVAMLGVSSASLVLGTPLRDFFELAVIAGSGASTISIFTIFIARKIRRASIKTYAVLLGIMPILVTVSGVLIAAKWMFISTHDLNALMVVIGVSAAIAVASAYEFVAAFARGTAQATKVAQSLSTFSDHVKTSPHVPAEFTNLEMELREIGNRLAHAQNRDAAMKLARSALYAWLVQDVESPLNGLQTILATTDNLNDKRSEIAEFVEVLGRVLHDLNDVNQDQQAVLDLSNDEDALRDYSRVFDIAFELANQVVIPLAEVTPNNVSTS